MATTPTEKIHMFIYFGNLFAGVLVLYVHNMHIKFHVNQISFFNNFFIKNRSHGTIHTFKNDFTTVFLVFNFSKISFI